MIYVLAFLALVMVACALACWLADDTVTADEATEPADDSVQDGPPCMVTHPTRCTNTATHDTWGWLTCDTHAPRRAA